MSMELKTCGCGRSPTGRCMGWHGLEEDEYLQKLNEFVQAVFEFQSKKVEEVLAKDGEAISKAPQG